MDATQEQAPVLPQPEGRVFGFFDSKSELDAFCNLLHKQGHDRSTLTVLEGEEGLHWIDDTADKFFFSDPEDQLLEFARNQLKIGHYAIGLPVHDRDEAATLSNLANLWHGHDFQYTGIWISERLP